MNDAVMELKVSLFDLGPKVRPEIGLTPVPGGTLAEIPDNSITNEEGKEDKDA